MITERLTTVIYTKHLNPDANGVAKTTQVHMPIDKAAKKYLELLEEANSSFRPSFASDQWNYQLEWDMNYDGGRRCLLLDNGELHVFTDPGKLKSLESVNPINHEQSK